MWNGSFSPIMRKGAIDAKWEPLQPHQSFDNLFSYRDKDGKEVGGSDVSVHGTAVLVGKPSDNASNDYLPDAYTDDQDGILWTTLPRGRGHRAGALYAFRCTFGQYMDLQRSRFDEATFDAIIDINYVGDWGWPWGRTTRTGWAAGK